MDIREFVECTLERVLECQQLFDDLKFVWSVVQSVCLADRAFHGCEAELAHVEGQGQELNELDPVL